MVIFSDIPNNSIYQWSENDGLKLYLKPSGETGSNGLILDKDGRLVMCQHGDRRMARMDAPLDQPASNFKTIVGSWNGKRFNSPNDAVYSSDGDLYFTDPAYGMELRYDDPKHEMDFTGVFRYSAGGEAELLASHMSAPNGIGFSPDEKRLYVANSGGGKKSVWMVYEIAGDGSLSEVQFFMMPLLHQTLSGERLMDW